MMRRSVSGLISVLVSCLLITASASAAGPVRREGNVEIRPSQLTGKASFLRAVDGGALPVAVPAGAQPTPIDFLNQYGSAFGISAPNQQLVQTKVHVDLLGFTHTVYEQRERGVPVFSGVIRVHQNAQGQFTAANGDFYPVSPKLKITPTLTGEEAVDAAREASEAPAAVSEHADLVVVDPGWYGDASIGAHLAFHVTIADPSIPMRESFFIDAHTGAVLDRWTMLHTARVREVYDGLGLEDLPGTLVRAEGDPPVVSPEDANRAYDYAGDVYDYFDRAFNRDSIDDAGITLLLTVNSTAPPCPNAFWNGTQMVFCTGTVTDDITAHEIAHGVTDYTANLIYQNQAGQLNEAFSDIFGELIDLYNGDVSLPGPPSGTPWPSHPTGPGEDTPNNLRTSCSAPPSYPDGVRWLVGEDADAFGGSIRDMWDPPCEGHPDHANSPLQTCNPLDNGGVHSGSGVANHAFAIMTDGKSFNGQTVTAIGPIKAGAVWYRALTNYLSVASDFDEAYAALNQAAQDLIGTFPNDPRTGAPIASMFTAADAEQVDKALLAVEMNTDGACGATVPILDPAPPVQCPTRATIFGDDFESGVNGWTTEMVGTPDNPYDWVQTTDLPLGESGTAWYVADPADGCPPGGEESAVHILRSPEITIPSPLGFARLRFVHFLATEPAWDGGNLKISVNEGPYEIIPGEAFLYNGYNAVINSVEDDNTNPLAGEPGYSGVGGGWGTTIVDLDGLVGAGDSVRIAFEFGKDYCNGVDGWYVGDFEVYHCVCGGDEDCDDGLHCNGAESCSGGVCEAGTGPCGSAYCDEGEDACLPTAFWDDFENGNDLGWDLYAPDSTAGTGDWEIGDPVGTNEGGEPAQPEDPAAGSGCAFTAQNSALGTHDVDSGVVYLQSPQFSLDGETSAELRYTRWFYQRDINDDNDDFFTVEVSSDDGDNWVNLETLGPADVANAWTEQTYALEDFVSLTGSMRVRFGASDGEFEGDIVEAAIDDVVVLLSAPPCLAPGVVAEGCRSLAITPQPGSTDVALRVAGVAGEPEVSCVSQYVQADGTLGGTPFYQSPMDWGTVHARGAEIIPEHEYEIVADCEFAFETLTSPSSSVTTGLWADTDSDGIVNLTDALHIVLAIEGENPGPPINALDLEPCELNGLVNLADALFVITTIEGGGFDGMGCAPVCD